MRIIGWQKKKKTEVPGIGVSQKSVPNSLKALCGENHELYEVLQYFVLGEPARQVSNLKSAQSFLEEGNASEGKGYRLQARINYEIAARIAIFYQDRETAVKALNLARNASDDKEHDARLETLLANLGKALEIAREYYKSRLPLEAAPMAGGNKPLARVA